MQNIFPYSARSTTTDLFRERGQGEPAVRRAIGFCKTSRLVSGLPFSSFFGAEHGV